MNRALALAVFLAACTPENDPESEVILAVKDVVATDLAELATASHALHDAAPVPDADGWQGGAELDASKAAWKDARNAYERIEGAIAVLFPDLDASTDERYDGFIAEAPDTYLFDDEGVTGVHAIERILWSDVQPAYVVEFESGLSGYVPAAFPANEQEATDYRELLVGRLETDIATMEADFEPLALDAAAAYEGVVGSMAEQVEKVGLAATGEAESRYAQHTLADMRANLDGGLAIYAAFSPWVASMDGGETIDGEVRDGFARVAAAYDALPGDALPAVPATWNPDAPSAADLATPYGELWSLLASETDPDAQGSLVERMVQAAKTVGIEIVP
ncbi:MAG: EfeM/EfeO family lipoprotein [Alphaproteobacteria bacterium]|nr:EfeM/EfeO family lipoprotein [Alphaproteobacteria bacterium]